MTMHPRWPFLQQLHRYVLIVISITTVGSLSVVPLKGVADLSSPEITTKAMGRVLSASEELFLGLVSPVETISHGWPVVSELSGIICQTMPDSYVRPTYRMISELVSTLRWKSNTTAAAVWNPSLHCYGTNYLIRDLFCFFWIKLINYPYSHCWMGESHCFMCSVYLCHQSEGL